MQQGRKGVYWNLERGTVTMPNPPWPKRSIALLTTVGAAHGAQIVNTFHFEATTATEATLTTDTLAQNAGLLLAQTWITNEKPEYMACLPVEYVMQMVRCQIIERPTLWRHRLTPSEVPSGGAGTAGGGMSVEDMDTTAVIRWRTPQAGKRFRGRSYLGPVVEPWKSNGLLTSTAVTSLTAFKDAHLVSWGASGAVPNGWVQTVYSRPYNTGEYQYTQRTASGLVVITPAEYAGNSTNITVGAVDPILRTQRRRQIGVGA